jgi:peptide/nickel transport system permease protein
MTAQVPESIGIPDFDDFDSSGQIAEAQSRGQSLQFLWYLLKKSRLTIIGFAIVAGLVIVAVVGPALVPYDPEEAVPAIQFQAPSLQHLFGTDDYGRDVFARVIYATRLDLLIAIAVTAVAMGLGTSIGVVAGYSRGRLGELIMRAVDVWMSFPGFILALSIVAAVGNTIENVVLAVAIAFTPRFIRIVRGEMLTYREREFVEAAHLAGNSSWRIMFRHLLPNTTAPVVIQATLTLGYAILDVAGLSFLGVGVRPPAPELGAITSEGSRLIVSGVWWVSTFAGFVILLAGLSFNLVGDGIRVILDPRLRK